jgi:cytochrome P450
MAAALEDNGRMSLGNLSQGSSKVRSLSQLDGPRKLPLLGNMLDIDSKRLHLILEEWAARYGSYFVIWFGPKPALIVSDSEAVLTVLRERPGTFRRTSAFRDVAEELLGPGGVLTAEGDAWGRQRRLVMAAFASGHMRVCMPSIVEITRRLWRRLATAARSGQVDILRELMAFTADVTTLVAFGHQLNTIEQGSQGIHHDVEVLFSALGSRVNIPFPYWRYLKLAGDREIERAIGRVKNQVHSIIRTKRAELEREPARAAAPANLLEAMIVARDAEDEKARLSDDEVYSNSVTMLLGGEDTTANSIAWILHFMALYPEVKARMREEAERELPNSELPTTLEDVQRLRYIAAVTQETLRLKSTAPTVFVEAAKDTVLGDVAVPAGTMILPLTRLLGLRDEHFSDAKTFSPERWLRGAGGGNHDPRISMAFGSGPRICPGRSLALLECTMVSALIARHFDIAHIGDPARVQERFDFAMEPTNLDLRFTPRAANAQAT